MAVLGPGEGWVPRSLGGGSGGRAGGEQGQGQENQNREHQAGKVGVGGEITAEAPWVAGALSPWG